MAGQTSEVEETLKRLQGHKGVIGVVIVNQDGIPIRTTFDQAVTVQYAGLLTQLCSKARSAVRELDPQVWRALLPPRPSRRAGALLSRALLRLLHPRCCRVPAHCRATEPSFVGADGSARRQGDTALQAGNVRSAPCSAAKVLTAYALFCCRPGPLCLRATERSHVPATTVQKARNHGRAGQGLPAHYHTRPQQSMSIYVSRHAFAFVHRDTQVLVADIDLELGALEALALGFVAEVERSRSCVGGRVAARLVGRLLGNAVRNCGRRAATHDCVNSFI